MGIAHRISPRDSIETVVGADVSEHEKLVSDKKKELESLGCLIMNTVSNFMPSHSDGTVKVTHIYYRRLLSV